MKASVNWISSFLSSSISVEEMTELLTRIGHEVDEVISVGQLPSGVILGKVLKVEKHPDADRLSVCLVDIGNGPDQPSQIICGAPNVKEGQLVAVALPGTTLSILDREGNPLTIGKAKIRGIESNGMICAEDELGLGDDHSGIMVLNEQANAAQIGTPISEVLNLKPDTILDIGLTPNRPDAASHMGLARDLAAATDVEFQHPVPVHNRSEFSISESLIEEGSTPSTPSNHSSPQIKILDRIGCPRYTGVVISGVTTTESPDWIKKRLESLGLRPVNNVVDITNWVLHETGQPLHAFDLDTFTSGTVTVQSFDKKVSFTTLDHSKREYAPGTLFICDGDKPVALAGIMGGEESEVSSKTTNIFLESAYFDPSIIRKTSKQSGLQTDASYRYERGIDPEASLSVAIYTAKMIQEVAGGEIQPVIQDVKTDAFPIRKQVSFRISRAEIILGVSLNADHVKRIFHKLDIQVKEGSSNQETWTCEIPSFRPDISREIDLIEEIGRIIDYNSLPVPQVQRAFVPSPLPEWETFKDRVRTIVSSIRYREIVTNSLLSAKAVQIFGIEDEIVHTLNPVSQDAVSLRSSLMGGFSQMVRFNINREADSLRCFEMGQVYAKTAAQGDWVSGIRERTHLLMGIAGVKAAETWREKETHYEFFDLKEDLFAFFESFGVRSELETKLETADDLGQDALVFKLSGDIVGRMVAFETEILKKVDVDLPMFVAEIDLSLLFTYLQKNSGHRKLFEEPSKFPSFSYDAAFIVQKDLEVEELSKTIKQTAGDSLQELFVFDLYEGESIGNDKKSVAFRMTFLDRNKTLSSTDVEPIVQKIVKILDSKFSAKLRS